jgi:ferredoxin-like protein FixX
MTVWFLRGLRRRVVTTRYPTRAEPSAAHLPSPPTFSADLLTPSLVTALVEACPSRALTRTDDVLVFDVGACTACGACFSVAGDAARPSGSVELAATSRDQLVKRLPILWEGGA